MKREIGLHYNSISPDITGTENNTSKYLHLTKGVHEFITVYVDEMIHSVDRNCKHNVAMLVEPISVSAGLYNWIEKNYNQFDIILTHHKPLLQISNKFKYYPVWPRIKMDNSNWIIPEKTKLISAIFSDKRMTDGTGKYMFQIVVENIFSGYVSEKANDCFANGTIPIYYGNSKSNINDYYDIDGVILFETLDELEYIINHTISKEYYNQRKKIINKNYNLAISNNVHNTIWNFGIKDFFNE